MIKTNITFIHGNDVAGSRKLLSDEKEKFPDHEIISLDGVNISISDLINAGDSISLFAPEKLIIVENFFKNKITKEKEELIKYLNSRMHKYLIIFWDNKEIDKKSLTRNFPNAKIICSSYPPLLFKFLDSIGCINSNLLISMFHDLIREKSTEVIFAMIVRQWRLLLIASDLGKPGLSKMAPWQIHKILKQVKNFTFKKLFISYRQLLSIDIKIKNGQSPYSLEQLLDIFLLSL